MENISSWFKDPDVSTLSKLEAMGEKVVWVKDFGDYYAFQTISTPERRKRYFGYENDTGPLYWKMNKKDGTVQWTEFVLLIMEGIKDKPDIDLLVLNKYR